MPYNKYGWKRAVARMNANKKKKDSTRVKGEIKKTAPPKLNFDFMRNAGVPDHKIDWNDSHTDRISSELKNHLSQSNMASILEMPKGYGKTAVSVACLGKIQEERGEKLNFVVSVTTQGLKDKSWQKHINSWNETFPDNKLEPYLITTADYLKKAIEHKDTLEDLKANLGKDGIVVIDEVHKFKNPTGRRAKALQKLSNKVLGISATPETNNIVSDIISYLVMAQYYPNMARAIKELNLEQYKDRYFQLSPYDKSGNIQKSWEEKDLFFEMWGRVRFRPSNISGIEKLLPKVHTHVVQLDYDEDLMADIRSLGYAYKNRMFDGFMSYYHEILRRIYADPKRIEKMIELISQPSAVQPLVFFEHIEIKDEVITRFEEQGISYKILDGSHKLTDKDKEDTNSVFLIQYKSGSEQIEFTKSNMTVFLENQPSYVLYDQSKGRNVRRNMEHEVEHYYLVSDIAFDKEFFQKMQDKSARNKGVADSEIEKFVKDMMK